MAQQLGLADDEIVVNVQGDEPLIAPELIREVAQSLAEHGEASIATACHPITDAESLLNPNVVKVVLDRTGHALYFSRAPIPYPRDSFALNQSALPAGAAKLPPYRHLRLSRPVSCACTAGWSRRRSNASRRWSNCARSGTVTASPLP